MSSSDVNQLAFTNYTQMPACDFNVDYTLTLIEKDYLSADQPAFDPTLEGITSDP